MCTSSLTGEDSFYERVFKAMGVPYEPVRQHRDINDITEGSTVHTQKQIEVDTLINLYRVRGHLIAHLDPLDWTEPHMHPELDPATHGLSVWDLEREFLTNGLAGSERMRLGDILGVLRDAYCRTLGVEYMHIQEPGQKRWIQEHVEGVSTQLSLDEQRWILDRLNAAEALEQFLNTKYIGQKRFGLEGGESTIPFLDAVLDDAAVAGQSQVVIGMAHRGRLNVLINIVGKSYGELFEEFEGNIDPGTVQGSVDVKYHKGFRGKFTGRSGRTIDVVLSSNPSHLEAVDPVVEGMVRAHQDQMDKEQGISGHPALPLLIHGDAAFAGQGVVAETLNMSALPGYETGGTVHLVINNQLGFTTNPQSARSSVYATDVAKMVQAPIFHVNGDDPEACVRVWAAWRSPFGRRSTRTSSSTWSATAGSATTSRTIPASPSRCSISSSKAIAASGSCTPRPSSAGVTSPWPKPRRCWPTSRRRLQAAFDETWPRAPPRRPTVLHPAAGAGAGAAADRDRCRALAAPAGRRCPGHASLTGFTVHPKLVRVFDTRAKLWAGGEADWALGEAPAYGTLLLLEGRDVRLAGQDTRRGTFGHRNAAVVDYVTGCRVHPAGRAG